MIIRFLIVVVALATVGCGTKKRSVAYKAPKPTQKKIYKPTTSAKAGSAKIDQSNLYPMPPDPGYFKKFPIANTQAYIETFAEIAQYEMRAFGIPASITLAQGILESGAGRGALTLKTNNHFGIKCHTDWQGDYDFHDDDAKGECFRKYNHPMFSFRDHSIFLASRSRYAFLFNYRKDDYKKWAYGLKRAGYATDSRYPQKLIALIEQFGLQEHDKAVSRKGLEMVRKPRKYKTFTHVVQKGDTLYAISRKYAISVAEIMKLNKLKDTNLGIGQVLNLRKVQLAP
ncbi:MAG: glucosaminidase domain-containing protein [Bacteroidota bacterium]